MEKAQIELIKRTHEIAPHDSDVVEMQWRSNLNKFFSLGHEQSVKRQIGIDLATCVMYGDIGPSEDEKDELYDRVLEWFVPTCLQLQNASFGPISIWGRNQFLQQCNHLGIDWTSSKHDDTERNLGTGGSWSATTSDELPLSARCAIVLDSGRDDGVTEACCERLSRMGAKVAVTFVGDEAEDGAMMICDLVERLCQAGGWAVAIRGIPYRTMSYSEQPPGVRFVEELINQALHDLGRNQFDIVGKSQSFAYDFSLACNSPKISLTCITSFLWCLPRLIKS